MNILWHINRVALRRDSDKLPIGVYSLLLERTVIDLDIIKDHLETLVYTTEEIFSTLNGLINQGLLEFHQVIQ